MSAQNARSEMFVLFFSKLLCYCCCILDYDYYSQAREREKAEESAVKKVKINRKKETEVGEIL